MGVVTVKQSPGTNGKYSGDPKSEPSDIRDILIPNFFKIGFGMVYTILKPELQ
jgi:hypothetical protein